MDKKELTIRLNNLQKECTELYYEFGLSEEVLDLQTVINRFRHKHNAMDEKEQLYKEYVQ